MLEKRRYAQSHLDDVRRRLMWEPRGHADMYGTIITEPVMPGSDCGVLFLHKDGFSTMCGHGIIGLSKVLVETGAVASSPSPTTIRIDTPAGLVVAHAAHADGVVGKVAFENVPSFVYLRGVEVAVPGFGETRCDIAFGGAYYAFCEADDLHLSLEPSQHDLLIEAGRLVKRALLAQVSVDDPRAPDLGFLYGVIFTAPPRDPEHHSRHVCVFADGEVDRSPTGTGVSARAALLHDAGRLAEGESITIESILGTCFDVMVVGQSQVEGVPAVIPRVSGEAYWTGTSSFFVETGDPLRDGFMFR
jgi:proline racemase